LGDLELFAAQAKACNPGIRIILTVSPVPLTATYGNEHVLVSTTHSKAILRAACSAMISRHPHVYYFPAYEIVTGSFSRGSYFEDNLRTVSPEGIAHVMRVFEQTYALAPSPDGISARSAQPAALFSDDDASVLCDEPEIIKSLGF
jgi:hypothetical protein